MVMADVCGPTFASELVAAGLGGLPIVWHRDKGIIEGRDALTAAQQAALDQVVAQHDPNKRPVPQEITKAQMLLWLLSIGKTQADVLAAINTIPDARDRD